MAEQVLLEVRYDTDQAQKDALDLKNRIDELTKSIEGEKNAQGQLKEAYKQGQITQDQYSTSLEESKQKQSQANTERRNAITLMNSEKGSVNQLKAEIKKLEIENNRLNLSTEAGRKQFAANQQKIAQYKQTIKEAGGETKKSSGFIGKLTGAVRNGVAQFALMTGAVLGSIKGLVKFAKKITEAGQAAGDTFAIRVEEAKAVTNTFFKALATGDFNNFIDRAKKAAEAAREFAMEIDTLNDLNRSLKVETAEVNKKVQKLEVIYKSMNKTDEERIAAIEEIQRLEKGLSEKKIEYSNRELNTTLKNISAQTGIKEEYLKLYVKEFDKIEDLYNEGVKYQMLLKEQEEFQNQKKGGVVFFGKTKEHIQEVNEELSKMTDSQRAAVKVVEYYGSANDEEFNKLADLYVQVADAEAQFDTKTKKNQVARATLDEQIRKEKEAKEKKFRENQAKEAEKAAKQEEERLKKGLEDLKYSLEIGDITQEQYYIKLAEYRDENYMKESDNYKALTLEIKKYYDQIAKEEEDRQKAEDERRQKALDSLREFNENRLLEQTKSNEDERELKEQFETERYEKEIENINLLDEEKELLEAEHLARMDEIKAEYHQKELDRINETLNRNLETFDIISEAAGAFTDERIAFNNQLIKSFEKLSKDEVLTEQEKYATITNLAQGFTSLVLSGQQRQLDNLMRQKETELSLAGDNEAAKEEIEKRYSKKLAQLKRKQFNEDKLKAITDTTIATALAVTKSLPNIPLSIVVGAAGAVQTGIIASKKAPVIDSDSVFERGGRVGVFGGRLHSQGGNNLFDGRGNFVANVQRDEGFFVMNQASTKFLNALSMINEKFGGRSLTTPVRHAQEGGQLTQSLDAREFAQALSDILPNRLVVPVESIKTGMQKYDNTINVGVV